MAKGKSFLDDRGITLPTVIITAVLALAAAAAGVVIYNVVRDRGSSLDDTAGIIEELRESFDTDRRIEERTRTDRALNNQFEDDEPTVATTGDGISDVLYLATDICPNLETRHWHSILENGKDSDPTRPLLPGRASRPGNTVIQIKKENPTLTPVNQNWIEADGSTIVLTPTISATKCSYQTTADYLDKIGDVTSVPNPIIGNAPAPTPQRQREIVYALTSSTTGRTSLRYSDCLKSGLAPATGETCELHFASSTVPNTPTARATTASIGATQRASWQLISYCAVAGGYIPFEAVPFTSSSTYETQNFNKCVINPSRFDRTCSLSSIGLQDPDTNTALNGFSISSSSTNQRCEIVEASKEANKIAVDSTSTRATYTELPTPKPGCIPWEIAGSNNMTGLKSGQKCTYTTSATCANVGLETDGSGCAYTIKDPNPECPTIFKVNTSTGRAQCEEPLGTVSSQWETLCRRWANTSTTMHDADNDGTQDDSDDDASVYAYYSTSTKTYRCSFKNRYTNGARECLSFGYQPGRLGECELIGERTYNPRPYAPTCAVVRATPYHTSQAQLWSINSLNLAFRNKAAETGAGNTALGVIGTTNVSIRDFLYDDDKQLIPNINNQLSYYYNRMIEAALESYTTSGQGQYTELWLPSQFPTGNVSWSRTYGNYRYPAASSFEDPTESDEIDYIYSRRSPSPISNCDDYKQFYRPIHIEESSTANTFNVGYNERAGGRGDKDVVCSGTSAQNFWEPRYYLEVLGPTDTYPTSGQYCSSGTTTTTSTCSGRLTNTRLYRECGLVGTDTAFTRPSEASNGTFDFANSGESGYRDDPMNTYVKECEDIGYSGGDTELYDYQLLDRIPFRSYQRLYVSIGLPPLDATPDWNDPANSDRNYIIGTQLGSSISYYDIWLRSDARSTRIHSTLPQIYLYTQEGAGVDRSDTNFEHEGGLTWTRYGISEILNHIHTRTLTNTSADNNTRPAVLRFVNNADFNVRNFARVETNWALRQRNPDDSTSPLVGYLAGGGWSADRGTITNGAYSSSLPRYAAYSDQECEFKVPASAPDNVEAFFRACQSLSTYFPTRFSYHKPIEVKTFDASDVMFPPNGSLPTGDNFGHWRQALVDDTSKDPALIKYGDANYTPPTYFHIKTDKTNGFYYCEANPNKGTTAGVIPTTAIRKTGTTAANSDCAALNSIIDATPGTTTFEQISNMSDIVAASAKGFVGHKEGPYDYYHCKWRAPFRGNRIATP